MFCIFKEAVVVKGTVMRKKKNQGKPTICLNPMLPKEFSAKKRAEIRAKEKGYLTK